MKKSFIKKLRTELDKEFSLWQDKLAGIGLDQKHRGYYMLGVLGGIRIALRAMERLK